MNKSHISQSGIRIFLKVLIILGLCTTAFIGLSAHEQSQQISYLNSTLLSTVILAKGPSAAEIKKHSSKTLKTGSKSDAVDEDKEIEKPNEPVKPRAAYIKLGDIKGESEDKKSRVPTHNPEWVNPNESDPGTAGNSQDAKHKEWIEVLSLSGSETRQEATELAKPTTEKPAAETVHMHIKGDTQSEPSESSNSSFGIEREMKESGEKGMISHELTHVNQSTSAEDSKHKEWIVIESMSSPLSKSKGTKAAVVPFQKKMKLDADGIVGAFAVEREMKESGEKGGTEDINIGVGELTECTAEGNANDRGCMDKESD